MKLLITLIIQLLQCIYELIKLVPTRRKITLISRQYDTCNVDYKCLIHEINKKYPQYECKVLTKTIPKRFLAKLRYGFHIFVQMYHIATSKVVILDTYCIPISLLKHKESLVVIQIWHAIGAMKKFGYSVIGKEEGSSEKIAEVMRMHKNYTYVCASSEYCRPYFAEAFHVELDKVIVYPLPRLDNLLNKQQQELVRNKIQETYLQLKHRSKQTILYVPTFRKNNRDMSVPIQNLINALDLKKYNLIVSIHPLSYHTVQNTEVVLQPSYDSYQLLTVADIVITDYSAILYEAALLRKSILFYLYDYHTYAVQRSFYMDLERDLPGPVCFTVKELVVQIENLEINKELINNFCTKYIAQPIENYTVDLVKFIMSKC